MPTITLLRYEFEIVIIYPSVGIYHLPKYNIVSTMGKNFSHILKYLKVIVCTLTCQIIVQQILLIFWEKNTYTTLLGPTRLLISEIFPSKPDFHLYK